MTRDKDKWVDWERKSNFTPEQIDALQEAANTLKKGMPWLLAARQEARIVAVRACFRRSVLGVMQDDLVLRAIYGAKSDPKNPNPGFHKILEAAVRCYTSSNNQQNISQLEGAPTGTLPWLAFELYKCADSGELFEPKTESEFFQGIAERLRRLETYKPTVGDFAVEAIQNAFVGLMQSKYAWGTKGLPTRGEVEQMAKSLLARDGKEKKSGWTDLRRIAGLDFLPEGRAGRPSKGEVDENRKAKQEALAIITKLCGGNWPKFRDAVKSASAGKKLFLRDERERLASYGHPAPLSEEEL